jgi:hypothetical protein
VPASETTTLHSGDVITFRAPAADGATSSVLITHRITAVIRSAGGATLYATRGDHNQTDDPAPVPASNVVAVYQFHVPLAGYLLRFAHTSPRVHRAPARPGGVAGRLRAGADVAAHAACGGERPRRKCVPRGSTAYALSHQPTGSAGPARPLHIHIIPQG